MQTAKLNMQLALWKDLVKELKKRGQGKRETGAFLLGPKDGDIITEFICYNDLDPHAFDTGIIVFNGDGFILLWKHCGQHGLKVMADVHTHPSEWTGQSSSDKKHPMIAQAGHIALIVPSYATKRNQLLKGVGVHEFLGSRIWKSWENSSEIFQLTK
jgi:hypothetical protein